MANISNSTSVIELCFLLLTCYTCLTAGTNLENRFLQFEKNFVSVKEALEAKVVILETKVARLEAKVEQQESQINALIFKEREKDQSSSTKKFTTSVELNQNYRRNAIFRTCHELRSSNPLLESGMYWIDPDGQGVGDDAIHVFCDMASGKTSIGHDSESEIDVGKCAEPGCYSRKINYYATDRQIESLIGLSIECEQMIKIDCNNAPLKVGGVDYSWYNSKNSNEKQTFYNWWNPLRSRNGSGERTHVEVYWAKNKPITLLKFGGTLNGWIYHTLGKLQCEGKAKTEGMPKSCEDLWRMGHTLNGIFAVKGNKSIESVYCDFNRRPNENGFQKRIGYADIKSEPVHFYVQRNSSFSKKGTSIPFHFARVNEGNAMDLASGKFTAPCPGTYFFSFSGIVEYSHLHKVQVYMYIGLHLNGDRIGGDFTEEESSYYHSSKRGPVSIQSTLKLDKDDKVWLQIYGSSDHIYLLEDRENHFSHFTGFILEENIVASL